MASRFRFVFVIFLVTAVLILTVWVRSENHRIFYKLCAVNVEQGRLKQQLWHKQLQVENLLNPAAISERVDR
jgi:predicted carbohydrate-binding protein with CBM5 and CBM33 domain